MTLIKITGLLKKNSAFIFRILKNKHLYLLLHSAKIFTVEKMMVFKKKIRFFITITKKIVYSKIKKIPEET